jgi:hypothetical protein
MVCSLLVVWRTARLLSFVVVRCFGLLCRLIVMFFGRRLCVGVDLLVLSELTDVDLLSFGSQAMVFLHFVLAH